MFQQEIITLLTATLPLSCSTTSFVEDPQPQLSDVRCAVLTEGLGTIGPLESLTVEDVRKHVLDSRKLPVLPETELREARYSEADALPPRPPLTPSEHAARLQGFASWCTKEPRPSGTWEGTVVNITNAKTLSIRPDGGQAQRVQLVGVQAPFIEQFGGAEALELVQETLERVENKVIVVPVSKSGRNLYASVLVMDEEGGYEPLGELLLRHGLAWWNERYTALDARLRTLHYGAKDARIGMFSQENVVSPRTFDRIRRKLEDGYRFNGEDIRARVVNVSDGDTLAVELTEEHVELVPALAEFVREGSGGSANVTIRLAGVDTPEIDQPGGVQSWAVTSLVCPVGEEITLILSDEGGYGRIAARVICPDGELLSEKLTRTGRARHYEYYVPDDRLSSLEDRARYAKIGVWSSPLSVVPGMWRDVHIDVSGLWVFEGDVHYLVVDADCDLETLEDQERITSSRFRDEFARERFDRLCEEWKTELVTSDR